MKKLKTKVFLTIFIILTISVMIVFSFMTIRNYVNKRNDVISVLSRLSLPLNGPIKESNPRRIFMEYTVYTIVLDNEGNYKGIINHTEKDVVDEEGIREIANKIIINHASHLHIGNLYFEQYSYSFTNTNTLIIMDNSKINSELLKNLLVSLLMFTLLETIIVFISYFLTKWISKPVLDSFEKQKRFIADASHELKTPLAVITASCDAYNNDQNIKWVNNIKCESERMSSLVLELLDLTYLESDKAITKKNENLSNTIESSILTFESVFFEKSIKLKYDIEKNIYYSYNESLIKQLMSILIDNAIKHTKEKGVVSINLSNNNKEIILEVKNKGLPIKKGDEEKTFERFYKADESRNRDDNSYGLGLAIAANIVQNHEGTIKAFSKSGYTTFKIKMNQK